MITNVCLEKDRFKVFATIEGNEEVMVFMPEVTAQEIRDWHTEREAYYADLKLKEEELKETLCQ